jgi:hypothetical protein
MHLTFTEEYLPVEDVGARKVWTQVMESADGASPDAAGIKVYPRLKK